MGKKKQDIAAEAAEAAEVLIAEPVEEMLVVFVGDGDNDPESIEMYGQMFTRGVKTDISELTDFAQAKIKGNTHFSVAS